MSNFSQNFGSHTEEPLNGESHLAAGPPELPSCDPAMIVADSPRVNTSGVPSLFPAAEQVFSFRTNSPLSSCPLGPLLEQSSSTGSSRTRPHEQVDHVDGPVYKSRRWTKEETNLWTTVKQFLQDPYSNTEPAVSCPICYTDIAIYGLRGQHPDPVEMANGTQKVGIVTICNHILCQDCFHKHIDSREEEFQAPACPVCRLELTHSFEGCQHLICPKRLPIFPTDTVDMIPLTLPERPDGARLPPQACLQCIQNTAQQYLDISLNYVANLVQGADNNYEENVQIIPGWANVVGHIGSVIGNFTTAAKHRSWTWAAPADVSLQIAFIDDPIVFSLDPEIRYSGRDALILLANSAQDYMHSAYWLVPYCRPKMCT